MTHVYPFLVLLCLGVASCSSWTSECFRNNKGIVKSKEATDILLEKVDRDLKKERLFILHEMKCGQDCNSFEECQNLVTVYYAWAKDLDDRQREEKEIFPSMTDCELRDKIPSLRLSKKVITNVCIRGKLRMDLLLEACSDEYMEMRELYGFRQEALVCRAPTIVPTQK